jgi:hypothetical protein
MAETRPTARNLRLFRFARIIAFVTAAIAVTASAYIRVEQFLFRQRVDQLLTDIRALELHQCNTQDVGRIVRKWGFGQLLTPEKCSDGNCDYTLELESSGVRVLRFLDGKPIVGHILIVLGGRPILAKTRIGVRHGTMCLRYFSLWIMVPGPNDQGLIMGIAGTPWPALSGESNWDRPAKVLAGYVRHGDYLVGTRTEVFNADTGGGPRAPVIWVEFSPESDTETVSRLMRFNLSCITGLRSCRQADLMPGVWSQLMEDEHNRPATLSCTTDLVKHVARLADAIVVVRINSEVLTPPPFANRPLRLSGANVLSVVKGYGRLGSNFERGVEIDGPENGFIVEGRTTLRAGEQYIFLLQIHTYSMSRAAALYPCGVLSLTQANLAMVQESAAGFTK